MHKHASGQRLPAQSRRRIAGALAAIVIPLAVLTVIALVVFWPRGGSPVGSIPLNDAKSQLVTGRIASVGETDALGQTDVTMMVEVPAGATDSRSARAGGGAENGETASRGETANSGAGRGAREAKVPLHEPAEIVASGLSAGDTVKARFTPEMLDSGVGYVFVDFERGPAMLWLAGLYVLAILAVAGRKGFMSLLGLATSLVVVGSFMIPALAAGQPAFPVVLAGGGAMMFLSIYLAHGVSIRTTTAVLGTAFGLVITSAIAAWAVGAQNLTGATGDEGAQLSWSLGGLNMSSLLLCGMVLAGLGALNDVTITQVSTIWELHGESPTTPRRRLFSRGMAIGRDHIASTVYTLAFAYVGSALPLLILASLYDRPFLDLLQVEQIAEEITRTLAASIGLILAIPATTLIAALLAPVAPASYSVAASSGRTSPSPSASGSAPLSGSDSPSETS